MGNEGSVRVCAHASVTHTHKWGKVKVSGEYRAPCSYVRDKVFIQKVRKHQTQQLVKNDALPQCVKMLNAMWTLHMLR